MPHSSNGAKPELKRLFDLQGLLVTFSNIERVIHKSNASKQFVHENDSEHSYNLAMIAWFLSEHFPELDQTTVIKLALAHDILEVHSGDTYIYGDPAHIASKPARETAALERLETEWPDFPEMTNYMHIYNTRNTPEAKFVYALDKILPILLIYQNNGYTWKKENITVEKLNDHKREKIALSPEIMPYYEEIYELLLRSPDIIKPH